MVHAFQQICALCNSSVTKLSAYKSVREHERSCGMKLCAGLLFLGLLANTGNGQMLGKLRLSPQ